MGFISLVLQGFFNAIYWISGRDLVVRFAYRKSGVRISESQCWRQKRHPTLVRFWVPTKSLCHPGRKLHDPAQETVMWSKSTLKCLTCSRILLICNKKISYQTRRVFCGEARDTDYPLTEWSQHPLKRELSSPNLCPPSNKKTIGKRD